MKSKYTKNGLFAAILLAAIAGAIHWLYPHEDKSTTALATFVLTEAEAIHIAARYIKDHTPDLDITRRTPVAIFTPKAVRFPSTQTEPLIEIAAWSVFFGVPSPPGYSRPILTYSLSVDIAGRVIFPPVTTSP